MGLSKACFKEKQKRQIKSQQCPMSPLCSCRGEERQGAAAPRPGLLGTGLDTAHRPSPVAFGHSWAWPQSFHDQRASRSGCPCAGRSSRVFPAAFLARQCPPPSQCKKPSLPAEAPQPAPAPPADPQARAITQGSLPAAGIRHGTRKKRQETGGLMQVFSVHQCF